MTDRRELGLVAGYITSEAVIFAAAIKILAFAKKEK